MHDGMVSACEAPASQPARPLSGRREATGRIRSGRRARAGASLIHTQAGLPARAASPPLPQPFVTTAAAALARTHACSHMQPLPLQSHFDSHRPARHRHRGAALVAPGAAVSTRACTGCLHASTAAARPQDRRTTMRLLVLLCTRSHTQSTQQVLGRGDQGRGRGPAPQDQERSR